MPTPTTTTAPTTRRTWRRALGKLLKAHCEARARIWPHVYRPMTSAELQGWLKRAWAEVGHQLRGLPRCLDYANPCPTGDDPRVVFSHVLMMWVVCDPYGAGWRHTIR